MEARLEKRKKNVCISFSLPPKSIHGMRKMLLVSFMERNHILLMISISDVMPRAPMELHSPGFHWARVSTQRNFHVKNIQYSQQNKIRSTVLRLFSFASMLETPPPFLTHFHRHRNFLHVFPRKNSTARESFFRHTARVLSFIYKPRQRTWMLPVCGECEVTGCKAMNKLFQNGTRKFDWKIY